MKSFDLTKPGGLPLTQNRLAYLQTAYTELFAALGLLGGTASTPIVVSGMLTTTTMSTITVTAGWLYYNGELLSFPGYTGSSALAPGHALYIVVSQTATPLTFNDSSTPNVVLENTAVIESLVNTTPVDATHVLFTSLVLFQKAFGANARAALASIAVAVASGSGGVTGTIYYKKDITANTLLVRTQAALLVNDPYNLASLPADTTVLLGTLPAGFRPPYTIPFTALASAVDGSGNVCLDASGLQYIQVINCTINSSGQINAQIPQPAAGCVAYVVDFNVVLSLD